jgi:hypothetical protein
MTPGLAGDNCPGQGGQLSPRAEGDKGQDTLSHKGVPCPLPHDREEDDLSPWMPPRATCHPACPWLDLAVGLLGLGYAPIPLGRDRLPLVKWGAYHVTAPGWADLYNRFPWADAAGVGLITGRPHALVVVDADDDESWAWALETLPAVRGVKTRRGGHLHFAHPPRGIIGNRSGDRAVIPAPGVRLDVKGLAGLATAPYSRHPSGILYEPLGDWTCHVRELPVLPDGIACQATDHPPATPPPRPPRPGSDPERALACYLAKAGGIPEEGHGSDEAVFRAAAWCKANVPELSEAAFVAAIRRERPHFAEAWIGAKWRSAKGR